MDAEMDHGPVVSRREFPLDGRPWAAPALSDALTDLGLELFLEILTPLARGKIAVQPQDHAAATYSRMLKKEDGRIAWSRPAREIERMVRAFVPWPGAYTFWRSGAGELRLALETAEYVMADAEDRAAGTTFMKNDQLMVQTGDGVLTVSRLTPEGARSMSGAEFLRGHPDIIGATLE